MRISTTGLCACHQYDRSLSVSVKQTIVTLFLITGFLSVPLAVAQMDITGKHDISEMMRTARKSFDMDKVDAVILLDDCRIHWQADGRMTTIVHRIIRINSDVVVSEYGDIRVPYDDTHQTFRLEALRTWRDDSWCESGMTAVVETTPSALRTAYDYNNRREMMLLHDGIELPCILESAYRIEDKISYRKGVDELWLFARRDPVLLSQFSIGLAPGKEPNVFVSPDVSVLQREYDGELDQYIYSYRMEQVAPFLPSETDDPAAFLPHVLWTTWEDWDDYGNDLKRSFEKSLKINDALQDSVDNLLTDTRTMTDKAHRIAEFVERSTRLVHYPEDYWLWATRPAHRIFETAYGHRLDRAILAGALFSEAGFEVFPVFRGMSYGDVTENVPSISRMDGIAVWVSGGDDVEAYYDPVSSELHNGLALIYNRTVWIPGSGDDPEVTWKGDGTRSLLEVRINLSYDEDKECWQGDGYYHAMHGLNPFDQMEGLADEAKNHLKAVTSGIINGAEITNFNPATFNRFVITAGFQFTAPVGEEDHYGRVNLVMGEPAGGLFERLPSGVDLHIEKHDSPLRLPGLMDQVVRLNIDMTGWEPVYTPMETAVENEIGSFRLSSEEKEERLIITRQLSFDSVDCSAEDWEKLRALLLADRNERNRTIMLSRSD